MLVRGPGKPGLLCGQDLVFVATAHYEDYVRPLQRLDTECCQRTGSQKQILTKCLKSDPNIYELYEYVTVELEFLGFYDIITGYWVAYN